MDSIVLLKTPKKDTLRLIKGNFKTYTDYSALSNKKGFCISRFGLNQTLYFLEGEVEITTKERVEKMEALRTSYQIKSEDINKTHYLMAVSTAIKKMQEKGSTLKKVVLANTKSIIKPINAFSLFIKLTEKYPKAFVYLTQLDENHIWIGASPELLIESEEAQRYRTVSLAGTLSQATETWTQKEQEEQSMVTDYIIQTLENQENQVEIEGPNEIENGHLRHLQTTLHIKAKDTNLFELAQLLHPTPAINGIPKKEAYHFIQKMEQDNREFYSGIIGLVQPEKSILHVNLRCARIAENGITLFAGAGITSQSNPEKEWVETQNKMNIIERLL